MESAVRSEFYADCVTQVTGSRFPLRRWTFPRPCGFPQPTAPEPFYQFRTSLSSGSAFLQSLTRPTLAEPAHGAPSSTTLLSFRSLQHSPASRIHSRGFATPASVRLQGLATLVTVCAPRNPAGLISCRRRSWDFSHPSKLSPPGRYPRPLRLPVNLHAVSQPLLRQANPSAGPTDLDFQALTLPRVPCPSQPG